MERERPSTFIESMVFSCLNNPNVERYCLRIMLYQRNLLPRKILTREYIDSIEAQSSHLVSSTTEEVSAGNFQRILYDSIIRAFQLEE